MTEKDRATPRPWRITDDEGSIGTDYFPNVARVSMGFAGRDSLREAYANRALIVRAVNAHDALVAACEDVLRVWNLPFDHADKKALTGRVMAALALAKGDDR